MCQNPSGHAARANACAAGLPDRGRIVQRAKVHNGFDTRFDAQFDSTPGSRSITPHPIQPLANGKLCKGKAYGDGVSKTLFFGRILFDLGFDSPYKPSCRISSGE